MKCSPYPLLLLAGVCLAGVCRAGVCRAGVGQAGERPHSKPPSEVTETSAVATPDNTTVLLETEPTTNVSSASATTLASATISSPPSSSSSPPRLTRSLPVSQPQYNAEGWQKTWPAGVVPYEFHPLFSVRARGLVAKSIALFNKRTCVRWVAATNQHHNKVQFWHAKGCSSEVGKNSFKGGLFFGPTTQHISIQEPGCDDLGTVLHEMLHAMGFGHEHNRWDRDKYVNVWTDRIEVDMMHNFEKADMPPLENWERNYPYEYKSIMHYESVGFAKRSGMLTMTHVDGSELFRNTEITDMDIHQVNALYKCDQYDKGDGQKKEGDDYGGGGGWGDDYDWDWDGGEWPPPFLSTTTPAPKISDGDELPPPSHVKDQFSISINVKEGGGGGGGGGDGDGDGGGDGGGDPECQGLFCFPYPLEPEGPGLWDEGEWRPMNKDGHRAGDLTKLDDASAADNLSARHLLVCLSACLLVWLV